MSHSNEDLSTLRLIDANFNRAGEGLRVMEDHARFLADDAVQSAQLKSLRHELAACRRCWPVDALLAARNVRGDVGRELSTAAEQHRADADAVVRAAARRAAEALRSLEEYAKIGGQRAAVATRLEALRYTVYESEAALLVGAARRRKLRDARLHVLITQSACRADWLTTARAALAGGATVLQLREKSLSDRELLQRAGQLRAMTRESGSLLIINDRPDIALTSDADGVHVGQDDLPVEAARAIVGNDRIVGLSTHSPEQVRAAGSQSPDYIAVGPMFASRTKPQDHTPGPALLQEAVTLVAGQIPIVAIGGINPGNIAELRAVGGNCVAVCETVVGAADAAAAAAELVAALND